MSETKADFEELERIFREKLEADGSTKDKVFEVLEKSEALMIDLLNGKKPTINTYPKAKAEFGPIIHIVRNMPDVLPTILKDVLRVILLIEDFPQSKMTPQMWDKFQSTLTGAGVGAGDGTLIQGNGKIEYFNKYIAYDPGWAVAFIMYMAYEYCEHLGFTKATFGTNPNTYKATPSDPSRGLKIAVIGDWGTGNWKDDNLPCPSSMVLDMIKTQNPDILIHLGDVYYAGTEDFAVGEEEKVKFVDILSGSGLTCPMFTLNSNHEMYDGGNGYFNVALKSNLFKHQQGTSYFTIEYNGWKIIGLDSAYYDKSGLYMEGNISRGQMDYITSQVTSPDDKVIFMTHHNPVDITGSVEVTSKNNPIPLWNQVMQAIDAFRIKECLWYWGHIHAGMAYSHTLIGGRNQPKCRCTGHASIPFADPYYLDQDTGKILYSAKTPLSERFPGRTTPGQANRVVNGFSMLTIDSSGNLTEEFYEVGLNAHAWIWPPSVSGVGPG